jgi:hypothetical protein
VLQLLPILSDAVPLNGIVNGQGQVSTQAMASFELFSKNGGIYDHDGNRVSIKGINWFGFETADFALHGLWCVNMLSTLDFTAQHFNAIRLPFSAELALDLDGKHPGNIDYSANPELQGLTTGQVMDRCEHLPLIQQQWHTYQGSRHRLCALSAHQTQICRFYTASQHGICSSVLLFDALCKFSEQCTMNHDTLLL